MRVVGLLSGGKDSCFSLMHCLANGHELVALANLQPTPPFDELDSFMYQTVGHDAVEAVASCLKLPLFRKEIQGGSVSQGLDYVQHAKDEVEDLYALLQAVKNSITDITAVSVGAILSEYQRIRVEHVCARLGLTVLAYLWQEDQEELLRSMFENQLTAVVIKVAAMGLSPQQHLGRSLEDLFPMLLSLHDKYDVHVAGEGGEYETLTVDCPLFRQQLLIHQISLVIKNPTNIAPVGYARIDKLETKDKSNTSAESILPAEVLIDQRDNHGGVRLRDDQVDCLLVQRLRRSLEDYLRSFPVLASPDAMVDLPSNQNIDIHTTRVYVRNSTTRSGPMWVLLGLAVNDQGETISSIEQETTLLLQQLQSHLEQDGLTLDHICNMTLWVASMADFASINAAYGRFFQYNPPSRITVGQRMFSSSRIVIDCIAAQPQLPQISKESMHVQSISNWAPANIGPYSQAARFGEMIFLAGQISLLPGSMLIPPLDSNRHCALALRHVLTVLKRWRCGWWHLSLGIVFVTATAALAKAKAFWNSVWKEDARWQPPMVFLQVQALPRNSPIEWAFTAVDAKTNAEDHEEDDESKPQYTIDVQQQTWDYTSACFHQHIHVIKRSRWLFATATFHLHGDDLSSFQHDREACLSSILGDDYQVIREQVFIAQSTSSSLSPCQNAVYVQALQDNASFVMTVWAHHL